MKILSKSSLVLLAAMFLIIEGCGTTGEVQDEGTTAAPPTEPVQTMPEPMPGVDKTTEVTTPEPKPVDPLDDPNSLLYQRIVYFDFDSSVVREDALPIIKAHADYLASNPQVSFTLEGHADERGTREYNLALGERRADSVRKLLIANGVAANQIRVISYGEERPAMLGHNESAWSANRRAEFMYANR